MSKIPEAILQDGCIAYAKTFLHGSGSLGDGIEAAYLTIQEHDDWVRAGPETWTGKGLPPVGVTCEFKFGHSVFPDLSWSEVRIVAHDKPCAKTFAVFMGVSGYGGCSEPEMFRPIRTSEQIASDDRNSAIDDMVSTALHQSYVITPAQAKIVFERIYDAGYRKQVAK